MIDRFGNKIRPPAGKDADPAYLKTELQFIWKGYGKDPTDVKAELLSIKGERLAAQLKKSLAIRSDLVLLEELIRAMMDHCLHTKNRNISWYMAWLCRDLYLSAPIVSAQGVSDMDHLAMSVYFFECYEKVEPTNQGRNLLVNSYSTCAGRLLGTSDPAKQKQALEYLEKARACERKIDPEYSRNSRFAISESMYARLSKLYMSMDKWQESYEAQLMVVHYAWKKVEQSKDRLSVNNLSDRCYQCITHPLYNREKDPIRLEEAVSLVEDFYGKGSIFTKPLSYRELKKYLSKT